MKKGSENFKAVRYYNSIVFIGPEDQCQRLMKRMIQDHFEYIKETAYSKEGYRIRIVDRFHATDSFLWELESFWLWIENDKEATADLDAITYAVQARKSLEAQSKYLDNRVGPFFRRQWPRYVDHLNKNGEEIPSAGGSFLNSLWGVMLNHAVGGVNVDEYAIKGHYTHVLDRMQREKLSAAINEIKSK